MLYLIIIVALWRMLKRWRAHCRALPYTVEDTPPPVEFTIADYLPQSIPQAEEQPDNAALDYAAAEFERLQALRQEYMDVLDAVEREQQALKREYDSASIKRQSTIATRLTTLASRHAATTRTLNGIDSKIEKQYYKLHI